MFFVRFVSLNLAKILTLSCALLLGSNLSAQPVEPILQQTDLQYVGAFRVPSGNFGGQKTDTLLNGGHNLAYNPSNNSLFMVGHPVEQLVGEIGIPSVVNSTSLSALNRATVLQNFVDVTEGHIRDVDPTSSEASLIGGLLVSGAKLYGTSYSYYDSDASAILSHFASGKNLNVAGDFQGMYRLNTFGAAGYVAGLMAWIPPQWQSYLGGTAITGQCCIPITRRTSVGPAAFSFNPTDIGNVDPVPATPLLYYTLTNPLRDNQSQNDVYNAGTYIEGVVFPVGSRTILFFGRQGTGPLCYGDAAACSDPAEVNKGYHAYPYRHQIWAYDALDLLAVKNGTKNPWDVQPYGTWTFTLPFDNDGRKRIYGAAYDPSTQRIF